MLQKDLVSENISKSFTFIKTEKEVYDAINKKIDLLQRKAKVILGMKSKLISLIGVKPMKSKEFVFHINEKNTLYYEYEITKDEYNKEPRSEVVKVKLEYNQLCYNLIRIMEEIKRFLKIKDNLNVSSKRKIELKEYELRTYGF